MMGLPAPAKLNLFLHVTGRRADGYHLLQSLFVPIDWQDSIDLHRRADGRIERHDIGASLPADDLCTCAARRLQQAAQVPWGVDIHLHKSIPMGAGLGGGSSDAATVLLGLNRLWNLGWSRQALIDLATPLGADIPFFLGGTPAIVEGIGERLTPVALRTRRYVVVRPAAGVETAKIFSSPDLARNTPAAIVEGLLADSAVLENLLDGKEMPQFYCGSGEASGAFTGFHPDNDLQPVAVALEPQVQQALSWVRSLWGRAQMTGSGSAVFVGEQAEDAHFLATTGSEAVFASLPAGWVGRICRSLEAHPLRNWASD